MAINKREVIKHLSQQTDELGEKVEASGLQWLSPQTDDLIREVYEHLREVKALLERVGGEV